jgi:lipopolysaccharide export system permease protein
MRARPLHQLAVRYILGEMIPTFFMGVIIFIFILLMFQALRLTEFVLVHGVKLSTIALMTSYMSISFLPLIFPMSLLFTVLLTYGRLSGDSEIVAFRAIGISMPALMAPAVILSVLICMLSLQTSFHIAPWGNRQFELLISKSGAAKPGIALKEGTFLEGFFDLVVYTNKVDSKTGKLSQVFIYDERNPDAPVTVIAREGRLVQDSEQLGHNASLRLIDGDIHRVSEGRHTKIDFSTYDLYLTDPVSSQATDKSPPSLTIEELKEKIDHETLKPEQKLELQTEYYKRSAIAFACIIFALIGAGIGTVTNRRNVKSGGSVICLGFIVGYYVMYVIAEGISRKGQIPPMIGMWAANAFFSIVAVLIIRRAWR